MEHKLAQEIWIGIFKNEKTNNNKNRGTKLVLFIFSTLDFSFRNLNRRGQYSSWFELMLTELLSLVDSTKQITIYCIL